VIQLVLGIILFILGLPFLVRGWIFSTKPDHPISLNARERNMRMGLETDLKLWGRKVRRFGTLLSLIGLAIVAWGVASLR
jgi:hypothetical protein